MRTAKGFTLVELTIVLIVIALLVAGVLTGRSMIENAGLQSATADLDMYRNAMLGYRTKYGQLPGDHTTANTLTTSDGGCPNPSASDTPTTATCGGNGDGFIGDTYGDPLASITNYNEPLLVWQHLSNMNMIPGQFNGRRTSATNAVTEGINVPKSKLNGASYTVRYFPTNTTASGYFQAPYGHVIFLGAPDSGSNGYRLPFTGGVLTPEQAKSIDQKIDDGSPGLGKVLTLPYSARPCPTNGNEQTSVYDSSISTRDCSLIFITSF